MAFTATRSAAERLTDRLVDRSPELAEHLTLLDDTQPGWVRLRIDGRYL
jgi:hypothetical protein